MNSKTYFCKHSFSDPRFIQRKIFVILSDNFNQLSMKLLKTTKTQKR